MKSDVFKLNSSYYTKVDRTKIYVDYTNKQIKIVDFENISVQNLRRIVHFSSKLRLGKITCKCGSELANIFAAAEFKLEGKIDGYFKGRDAFCMSYFINNDRKNCSNYDKKDLIIEQCLKAKNTFTGTPNDFQYKIRSADETDIEDILNLYSKVFSPTFLSMYGEDYLRTVIAQKLLCKVAECNNKIIGIACALTDRQNLNARIVGCAVSPNYRYKGILSNIIYFLEADLKNTGFKTLYSLPSSINPGINIVLSKLNYSFTGRLVNNYNICNTFEDMNIWVKNIT